jgi:hypothetical protein
MTRDELLLKYEGKTGVLTAVEEGTVPNTDRWSEPTCNTFPFTLDGVTYTAIEDPGDGYRSYCGDFEVGPARARRSSARFVSA